MWTVYENKFPQFRVNNPASINLGNLLAARERRQDATPVTLSIQNSEGQVIASVSNRAITGQFLKQAWGGRTGDDAISIEEINFDATSAVLRLSYTTIKSLKDRRESTDEIGLSVINWSGPCEVEIVESICDYFGVASLEELTEENYQFVINRMNPAPAQTVEVSVTYQVSLAIEPGVEVDAVMNRLETSIASTVPGAIVRQIAKSNHALVEEPSVAH